MESQLPLCSPNGRVSGIFLREEAIIRLEGKYSRWIADKALPALLITAQRFEFFTSDDVWVYMIENFLGTEHIEKRVMGAVLKRAIKQAWVVSTGTFEQSCMSQCHARPKQLWRSLIYVKPVLLPLADEKQVCETPVFGR